MIRLEPRCPQPCRRAPPGRTLDSPMPALRDVLAHLTRDELLAAVVRFELDVAHRRVKNQLVDAVASSKKAGLADVLAPLSRYRLKQVCRGLGLDEAGKEKAVLVERLTGASAKTAPIVVPTAAPEQPSPRTP